MGWWTQHWRSYSVVSVHAIGLLTNWSQQVVVSFFLSVWGYTISNQHENMSLGPATEFGCNHQWSSSKITIRYIVNFSIKICIQKNVFDNCTRVTVSDVVSVIHPWGGISQWMVAFILDSKTSPWCIINRSWVNSFVEVLVVHKWWLILMYCKQ